MTTLFKPLYLVITEANTTLQQLNKNFKFLSNVQINWERRRNERELLQCKKCYQWGHSTTNCHRQQKCPKCSGPHTFLECKATYDKCVNCGENHRSTDINCPVYIFKTSKLPNREPQYVPAPPPTYNRWQQGRASAPTERVRANNPTEPPRYQHSQQDFPPLPSARSTQGGVASHDGMAKRSDDATQMCDLFSAVRELKSLINIPELIRFTKELADFVRNEQPQQRGLAALHFITENMDKYAI